MTRMKMDGQGRLFWGRQLDHIFPRATFLRFPDRILVFPTEVLNLFSPVFLSLVKRFDSIDLDDWWSSALASGEEVNTKRGEKIPVPRSVFDAKALKVASACNAPIVFEVVNLGGFVELIPPPDIQERMRSSFPGMGVDPRRKKVGKCPDKPGRKEKVKISEIDVEDRTARCLPRWDMSRLTESIREEGQRDPVILFGRKQPYKVLDGFQRVKVLKALGRDEVVAIVMRACPTGLCRELRNALEGVVPSEQRLPLGIFKEAIKLHGQGKPAREIALILKRSERTIRNYIKLKSAPEWLMDLLERGEISLYVALEIMKACMTSAEMEAFRKEGKGRITVRTVRAWRKEAGEERDLL